MKPIQSAALGLVFSSSACLLSMGCAEPVAGERMKSSESHLEGGDPTDDTSPTGTMEIGSDATDPALLQEIVSAVSSDLVALGLDDEGPTNGTLGTASLHTRGVKIGGVDACGVLRQLRPFEHAYFFGGVVASGGLAATANYGVEGVVDIYNQQAAAFNFNGGGLGLVAGVSVGPYTGVATDLHARVGSDIRTTWSGIFVSASVAVGLGKFFSASASAFTSTDGSIVGVNAGVGGGFGAPIPVSPSIQDSDYTFDGGKTQSLFGGTGDRPAFLNSAVGVTRAVLKVSPGLSVPGVPLSRSYITAFLVQSVLKTKYRGTSLSALCPG